MASKGPHCSFVLLAEFDIDSGAQLTYQFPQPLGTDEGWDTLELFVFSQLIVGLQTACQLDASRWSRETS